MSIRAKQAIARACIGIGIGCLAAQAIGVRTIHHSLALTVVALIFPALAVLFGLNYLRLTKTRQ